MNFYLFSNRVHAMLKWTQLLTVPSYPNREDLMMQPLIIIATPNVCWLKPEVDYPRTPEAIAEEARLCCEWTSSL